MARRRKRVSKVNRKRQRDLTTTYRITRRTKRLYTPTRLLGALPLADLRTFTPSRYARRALRDSGIPAAIGIDQLQRRKGRLVRLPSSLAFIDPRRVSVCIRRKVRREVLHAIHKTGGGAPLQKRRRRTPYSHIKC